MKTFLKNALRRAHLVLEVLKGVATVREVERSGEEVCRITGSTISGFDLTFRCDKKTFYRTSEGFLKTQTEHNTYYVTCEVDDQAPEDLKNVCKAMEVFPPLLPNSLSDFCQGEAAINAYLDLILQRFPPHHQLNAGI